MTIPATGRFTALTIQQHFNQAKIDNAGQTVKASLSLAAKPGDKSLKFGAKVRITADGVSVAVYDLASDTSGAVQSFKDVDSAVKVIAKIVPAPDGIYPVSVEVGTVLDKMPPSDLVKAATSDRTKAQSDKTKVQAKIADHDAQLALMVGWESGNAMQAARKAEVLLQKATLNQLVTSLDAEIARLTALIGG